MLPNAHVENLRGCGHSMLTEQPNQVLDVLSAFILN
jgi:pimeloyl-ACP methyl ester carboxylesterase